MRTNLPGSGPDRDPGQSFLNVLRNARLPSGAEHATCPDPHRHLNDKKIEANALEAFIIGEFWDYFCAARQRSGNHPALGNLVGDSPLFLLTQEAYEHKFRSLDTAELGRTLQNLLIDGIQGGYQCWENERRTTSSPDQQIEHAYSRLQALVAEKGVTQGTKNVPILILEGMGTSLGSIMACVRIIPEVYQNNLNAQIDRITYRHLIHEVFSMHTRLARASFPIFMKFASQPLLPGASNMISYDPSYFTVFRDGTGCHFSPTHELTKSLEEVVSSQRQSPATDTLIQNCPAIHAKAALNQSHQKPFISGFYDWIMENLETFYLGRFPSPAVAAGV